MEKKLETFTPTSRQDWRTWLIEHHASVPSIWIVCYKQKSGIPTITWSDAVDEALCFGWIDSTRRSVDENTFVQFFCQRKPKSNWSKINKEKVKRLIEEGRMMPAGLKSIEVAKQNGSWTILDEVEELLVPDDLEHALEEHPKAKEYFLGLSKSVRKMMLYWVTSAKRAETRQNRIQEIATFAAQQQRPKQFR